jgi:site-specific DNA-methyltransferase (adenine-specific)
MKGRIIINIEPYFKTNNVTLYQSDNLELLKQIPNNHIDLIYCDILYGTGRNFGDYQDLKANKKIIEEHYIPRFKEMYKILKDTGSIYLHMDAKIVHWIRNIMDDIYGYNNFKNEIIWKFATSGRRSKSKFYHTYDIILKYAKSFKYEMKDCNLDYEIDTSNYTGYFQDIDGWFNLGAVGDYSETSLEKLKKENKLYKTKKGTYYLKCYVKEKDGKLFKTKQISDVWDDIMSLQTITTKKEIRNQKTGYATQKPKELLERIIKVSSDKGDLVADFYMGSGTTGEVALELGRRFIGCDIGDNACEISKERINKVINTPDQI